MSIPPSSPTFSPGGDVPLGVQRKRWTRDQYYALAEQGYFREQHVELIEGEIIVTSPRGFPHFSTCDLIAEKLRSLFGKGYWLRQQAPLAINATSDPEPDISVVRGSRSDYAAHAATAVLVVEVSQTTLRYDLQVKPAIYASAGVTEYWVVDLATRRLHLFRQPRPDGSGYAEVSILDEAAALAPVACPDAPLAVRELLPSAN